MKKIKIAYIIDTIITPNAGTEKQLLLLLNSIDKNRFSPTLICLRESDFIKNYNFPVKVEIFEMESIKNIAFWKNFIRLIKFLKEQQFHIVQTFFKDGNIIGTLAAKLAKIPVVISSRRNIGYWHNQLQISILKILSKFTDYYLANSEAVKKITVEREGVPPSRIKVIYNGIDTERFFSKCRHKDEKLERLNTFTKNHFIIGIVSNLRPVKNIDFFLDAAKKIKTQIKNARFVIVGEGPLKEKLMKKAEDLGISDDVFFAGSQSHIQEWIEKFDIAVMCSKSESFSNTLIEYMLLKKPIIASNVGGNKEAITHNENGLLYQEGDMNDFIQSFFYLYNNPGKRKMFAEKAQLKALEKYSLTRCVKGHEQFYDSLLKAETCSGEKYEKAY